MSEERERLAIGMIDRMLLGNPTIDTPEDHIRWLTSQLRDLRLILSSRLPAPGTAYEAAAIEAVRRALILLEEKKTS